MNIIKHIFYLSFALTAWNAYTMDMRALTQGFSSWQQEEMCAVAYGLTLEPEEQEQYFNDLHNYISSPEWEQEVKRSPNAKEASKKLLQESLSYSEFVRANQQTSPSKKCYPTPNTSPYKPIKNKKINLQPACIRRLLFDDESK